MEEFIARNPEIGVSIDFMKEIRAVKSLARLSCGRAAFLNASM